MTGYWISTKLCLSWVVSIETILVPKSGVINDNDKIVMTASFFICHGFPYEGHYYSQSGPNVSFFCFYLSKAKVHGPSILETLFLLSSKLVFKYFVWPIPFSNTSIFIRRTLKLNPTNTIFQYCCCCCCCCCCYWCRLVVVMFLLCFWGMIIASGTACQRMATASYPQLNFLLLCWPWEANWKDAPS